MHSRASHIKIIALLAVPQVLSWGTLYYAFAILAAVIAWNSSAAVLFGLLFAFSIASLLFYLMAVRSELPANVTQLTSP